MRVLVECTHVYDHPYMNTGIQRVVRNVIRNLKDVDISVDLIPVVFKNNRIYKVLRLEPTEKKELIPLFRERLETGKGNYWKIHHQFWSRLSHKPNLQRFCHRLFRLGSLWYLVPKAILLLVSRYIVSDERIQELPVEDDDILLLLDSSWDSDCAPTVDQLKRRGVRIVSVIYDLIPLTHPQFCDENLVKIFERWFDWVVFTADGFVAISQTIRDELKQTLSKRMGSDAISSRTFDYFYLGHEIGKPMHDRTEAGNQISSKVSDAFAGTQSVYLMVGTIEPRKNHSFLLDVFEKLWDQGENVKLCIVGRVGWKCEALINRIERHAQLNRLLFMFNDLDDSHLKYCYGNAKALVFPSFVEGFGLPLVEALEEGVPVMASDIPVFREICGEYAAYFDLSSIDSLVQCIAEYEKTGSFPAKIHLNGWTWITWKESTQRLLEAVQRCKPKYLMRLENNVETEVTLECLAEKKRLAG